MSNLEHLPEPVGRLGGGLGDARVLGAVENPAVTLAREMIQNSWDARRDSAKKVVVDLDVRVLDERAARSLRNGLKMRPGTGNVLNEHWRSKGPLPILIVRDRGTVGLDGEIDPQLAVNEARFAQFVYLMGHRKGVAGGEAGTYGFGKTIAYVASRASTAVMYSRVAVNGGFETRLIAAAIGTPFEADGRRYTGRHWWGDVIDGGLAVHPLRGKRAEALALKFGFTPYRARETGLAVMIIDPLIPEQEDGRPMEPRVGAARLARELAGAVAWNFWPRLISTRSGDPSLEVKVRHDGKPISVPEIVRSPPLDLFVKAFRELKTPAEERNSLVADVLVDELRGRGGAAGTYVLGEIALAEGRYVVADHQPYGTAADIEGPSHHVALMRDVELVVAYRAFPDNIPSDPDVQWAGVFVASQRASDALAASEPPQHNEWSEANISPRNQPDARKRRSWKTAVRAVRNAIEDVVQTRWSSPKPSAEPSSPSLLNRFARAGEFLVAGLPGTRPPRVQAERDPRRRARRSESPVVIGVPELAVEDDEVVARYPVQIRTPLEPGSTLTCIAEIEMRGARPEGARQPRVLRWEESDGKVAAAGQSLTLRGRARGPWTTVVSNPEGAAMRATVTVATRQTRGAKRA